MNTFIHSKLEQSDVQYNYFNQSGLSKKDNPILKRKEDIDKTTQNIHLNTKEIETDVNTDQNAVIDYSKNIVQKPMFKNPYYEEWFSDEDMDYVGIILVFYHERETPRGIDQLYIWIREKTYYFTYPILFEEDEDPDSFTYKKYIYKKCKEYFNLCKKNIDSIQYFNELNGIRNYIVRLKKLYSCHDTYQSTINCVDNTKYIWRPYFIPDIKYIQKYSIQSDYPDNYQSIHIKDIYTNLKHT